MNLGFLVTVAADSAWWVLLPIVPPLLITAGFLLSPPAARALVSAAPARHRDA